MIQEQIAHKPSVISRIDPCIRIVCTVVLSFAAALSQNIRVALLYCTAALLITLLSRLGIIDVMKRLKPLLWFLVMIWLVLPVTYSGTPSFFLGPVAVSSEGILLCRLITLKSVTIVLVFMALMATLSPATLGHGLHRIHVPDKLVFLFLMTYRYIFVIEDEYRRLLRAAKFRGFKPGTNMHSYRTWAYLAGMLFVRASKRANRVHQAMLCRGFKGKFHTLDVFGSRRTDLLFLTTIIVVTAALIFFEYGVDFIL